MKVDSNSKLIYLLINNELAERSGARTCPSGNLIRDHRQEKEKRRRRRGENMSRVFHVFNAENM